MPRMRRYQLALVTLVTLTALGVWGGCDRQEESEGMPGMLRTRFESEMKTILRDVRSAQEQAMALEDRYLALEALRGRYLSRQVPESYRLSVGEVSAQGYLAEVVHAASGIRCRLRVVEEGVEGPSCE